MDPQPSPDLGNGRLAAHGILVKFAWAMLSEPGVVRPSNEDYLGVHAPTTPDDSWDRGPLFILADGLGGHAAGEVASRLAVDAVLDRWRTGSPGAPHAWLRAAVRDANAAVFEAAFDRERRGMGTTLTALTLAGSEAVVAHVGDSRAYLVRTGHCTQLTADHSRAADMLRMRLLTPEQAAAHPARSMLTRSLGADPAVQIDVTRHAIEKGDVLVLCSDGLWDMVPRHEIGEVCGTIGTEAAPTVSEAAAALIGLAMKRGAPDNISVIVVRITSPRPIPPVPRRSFFRRGGG